MSRTLNRKVPGSKPEEPPCKWIRCTPNPSGPNAPAGVVRKLGEGGLPAQVSSSVPDRGSKLQGPSQNSSRLASERDVNLTNLKILVSSSSNVAKTEV
ncbi:hypothetical protein AVEN_127698-1 [Araneus ventricosus]|uniref:Uncharacterized protein n=1 Tax=Araneus ventricosus TaxID=182803 RepID=A0A4Y2QRA8_ARAVE|nr:hypothetical protein AVEN_127698-1 [Araneus ventricosus]